MTQLEELKSTILTSETTGDTYTCQTTKIGYETMLSLNSEIYAGLPTPSGDDIDLDFATGFSGNQSKVVIKLIKKFFCIPNEVSLDDFDEELIVKVQNLIIEIGFLVRILGVRSLL
jgi:hypothetical protein